MEIKSALSEYGLTEVLAFNPEKIKITPDVRKMCEQNSCGQYGRNYMCPPFIKSLDECEKEIRSFNNAVIFTGAYPIKNSFDFEGMMDAAADFGKTIQKMKKTVKERYPDKIFLFLGAGGCPVCPECACVNDEPCRFPGEAFSSVEANGIEVLGLCRELGIRYNNGNNSVTYIGMVLYR